MFHILGVSLVEAKNGEQKLADPSSPSGKFTCTLIHGIRNAVGYQLIAMGLTRHPEEK